jgi:fermentation-respiration switch protein FrsA (DUF1100 family)
MSAEAIGDLDAIARLLAAREGVDAGRVCARGSSLGGFVAIHGAAGSEAIAGVIAICPAGEQHLLRGLRHETLEMRTDEGSRRALELWLSEHDLRTAVTALRGRPLILIHADADEQIPSDWSRLLYEAAGEPSRLIIVPGGHHRSVQHDPELAAVALHWLERALDADQQG